MKVWLATRCQGRFGEPFGRTLTAAERPLTLQGFSMTSISQYIILIFSPFFWYYFTSVS